jgi:threonine/homoserine/homoserine lactone efflux protein
MANLVMRQHFRVLELLAAFSLFAAVMLFTPGPNNIMLMISR